MTDIKGTKSHQRAASRPFNEVVGAKVKALRIGAGLSQTAVASHLGISSQQLHKYEAGKDRLAVYTLQQIANLLAVPITMVFDDLQTPSGSITEVRETMRMVAAIQRLKDSATRRCLMTLIEELDVVDDKGAEPATGHEKNR